MSLDFFSPLDWFKALGFNPVGVESKFMQKLFDSNDFEILLLFLCLLEALDGSEVSK